MTNPHRYFNLTLLGWWLMWAILFSPLANADKITIDPDSDGTFASWTLGSGVEVNPISNCVQLETGNGTVFAINSPLGNILPDDPTLGFDLLQVSSTGQTNSVGVVGTEDVILIQDAGAGSNQRTLYRFQNPENWDLGTPGGVVYVSVFPEWNTGTGALNLGFGDDSGSEQIQFIINDGTTPSTGGISLLTFSGGDRVYISGVAVPTQYLTLYFSMISDTFDAFVLSSDFVWVKIYDDIAIGAPPLDQVQFGSSSSPGQSRSRWNFFKFSGAYNAVPYGTNSPTATSPCLTMNTLNINGVGLFGIQNVTNDGDMRNCRVRSAPDANSSCEQGTYSMGYLNATDLDAALLANPITVFNGTGQIDCQLASDGDSTSQICGGYLQGDEPVGGGGSRSRFGRPIGPKGGFN